MTFTLRMNDPGPIPTVTSAISTHSILNNPIMLPQAIYQQAGIPFNLLGQPYQKWRSDDLRLLLDNFGITTSEAAQKIDLMHGVHHLIENGLMPDDPDTLARLQQGRSLPSPIGVDTMALRGRPLEDVLGGEFTSARIKNFQRQRRRFTSEDFLLPNLNASSPTVSSRPVSREGDAEAKMVEDGDDNEDVLPVKTDCAVCMEPLSAEVQKSSKITRRCNHRRDVCDDCLRQAITIDLEQKVWDRIGCPSCGTLLAQEDVIRHGEAKAVAKYEERLTLASLSSDPNFHLCRHPGCTFGQEMAPDTNQQFMTCLQCHQLTCLSCRTVWHAGISCAQNIRNIKGPTAEQRKEEEASEALVAKTSKTCPNATCGARVDKVSGCDHMRCSRCASQYCWECQADQQKIWDEGNSAHKKGCKHWRPAGNESSDMSDMSDDEDDRSHDGSDEDAHPPGRPERRQPPERPERQRRGAIGGWPVGPPFPTRGPGARARYVYPRGPEPRPLIPDDYVPVEHWGLDPLASPAEFANERRAILQRMEMFQEEERRLVADHRARATEAVNQRGADALAAMTREDLHDLEEFAIPRRPPIQERAVPLTQMTPARMSEAAMRRRRNNLIRATEPVSQREAVPARISDERHQEAQRLLAGPLARAAETANHHAPVRPQVGITPEELQESQRRRADSHTRAAETVNHHARVRPQVGITREQYIEEQRLRAVNQHRVVDNEERLHQAIETTSPGRHTQLNTQPAMPEADQQVLQANQRRREQAYAAANIIPHTADPYVPYSGRHLANTDIREQERKPDQERSQQRRQEIQSSAEQRAENVTAPNHTNMAAHNQEHPPQPQNGHPQQQQQQERTEEQASARPSSDFAVLPPHLPAMTFAGFPRRADRTQPPAGGPPTFSLPGLRYQTSSPLGLRLHPFPPFGFLTPPPPPPPAPPCMDNTNTTASATPSSEHVRSTTTPPGSPPARLRNTTTTPLSATGTQQSADPAESLTDAEVPAVGQRWHVRMDGTDEWQFVLEGWGGDGGGGTDEGVHKRRRIGGGVGEEDGEW